VAQQLHDLFMAAEGSVREPLAPARNSVSAVSIVAWVEVVIGGTVTACHDGSRVVTRSARFGSYQQHGGGG